MPLEKCEKNRPENINFRELTLGEIKTAEHQIIVQAQIKCYHEVPNSLRNKKLLLKTSAMLSVRPMLTDNLLHVRGRLIQSKHQITFAKKHHLSGILLKDLHIRSYHPGRDLTLNFLRERFWTIHESIAFRKVLLNCSYCKQQRILPTSTLLSDLSVERVSVLSSSFMYARIVYFEPYVVKLSRKTKSNQAICRRYTAVLTCLASRALHIELADSFILALRRFTVRKDNPQTITSNNGTNFIRA